MDNSNMKFKSISLQNSVIYNGVLENMPNGFVRIVGKIPKTLVNKNAFAKYDALAQAVFLQGDMTVDPEQYPNWPKHKIRTCGFFRRELLEEYADTHAVMVDDSFVTHASAIIRIEEEI